MPKPKKNLDAQTRDKIANALPDAITHAIQSYKDFYRIKTPTDEKEDRTKVFLTHHTACKVAISHIQLLLKLAEWAQLPRGPEDLDLAVLMRDARGELARYNDEDIDE